MDFTTITHSMSPATALQGIKVCDAAKNGGLSVAASEMAKRGFSVDAQKICDAMASDAGYKEAMTQMMKDSGYAFGDNNIDAIGQFFLVWMEQTINRLYRGRTAIQTFGVKTVGNWTTEKVVFKTRELTASNAGLYSDFSRPTYVGYNYGYDSRDTLRLEWGIEVTKLEEMIASVMRRNAYSDKKDALALSQSIWENNFFWNGITIGDKKIYGALNDPNLSTRVQNLPEYDGKDISDADCPMEATIDTLRSMKQKLTTDLAGNGDADTLPVRILCPLAWQQVFTALSASYPIGYTPNKWRSENWKNATIEFKPELDDLNQCIVFVESVPGVGLDTFNLMRTSALRLVGAMPSRKGREEAYSSSIAGAMVAAPIGVTIYESNN